MARVMWWCTAPWRVRIYKYKQTTIKTCSKHMFDYKWPKNDLAIIFHKLFMHIEKHKSNKNDRTYRVNKLFLILNILFENINNKCFHNFKERKSFRKWNMPLLLLSIVYILCYDYLRTVCKDSFNSIKRIMCRYTTASLMIASCGTMSMFFSWLLCEGVWTNFDRLDARTSRLALFDWQFANCISFFVRASDEIGKKKESILAAAAALHKRTTSVKRGIAGGLILLRAPISKIQMCFVTDLYCIYIR